MKRTILALCAAFLITTGLCCRQVVLLNRNLSRLLAAQPAAAEPAPSEPAPAPSDWINPMGSVGLLSERTVLVSLYLDANGETWSDSETAQMQVFLSLAVDWLRDEAARYGKNIDLITELEDSRLHYRMELDFQAPDGTEDLDEKFDSLLLAAWDKITADGAASRHNTDRIGFMVFLPIRGQDYTMVYEASFAGAGYNEYSVLYQYDIFMEEQDAWEGPSVIAHELLHMFGAYDLYEDSCDHEITPEIRAYIAGQYPDEIMYYTYNSDDGIDYDGVHKQISPLTAYRVGLTDDLQDFSEFQNLRHNRPGIFGEYLLPGSEAA